MLATSFGSPHSFSCPGFKTYQLVLTDRRQESHNASPEWALSVERFCQRSEADALGVEIEDHVHHLAHRTAEAVELPYDERAAGRQCSECPVEAGPVVGRPSRIILEHLNATRSLQRVELVGRVLVVNGNARIADQHAVNYARTLLRDSALLIARV